MASIAIVPEDQVHDVVDVADVEESSEHGHSHSHGEHGHSHSHGEHDHAAETGANAVARHQARLVEAFDKLNMKPLPDTVRVQFANARRAQIVIDQPTIYQASATMFVILGQPRMENPNTLNQQALEQLRALIESQQAAAKANLAAGGDDDEEITGDFPEEDVAQVMEQAGVDRATAVRALAKNGGEIIAAIMNASA
ncbi:hypothetical protein H696_02972 [Fonticula alba]|uniref:NAC-A/B domain-containing protein n=1 Tax=Fonticula alba TaxID=691883 RepID=A0A058Z8N6_FONAL|nr:hypothetical protein H696_02972 [Fonticula alba]KCV70615.1 hypothetical protein H696_02972 [Fonticula alba]|eukprot:XP_009495131.1 hypothetical protein H696_02972 [Fonticula alba]